MNCLTEKTIGELLEYKFFIPSYQRGYRWTERHVADLLEDINAFIPTPIEKTGKKTWYCLQPIVIKECDEKTKTKIESGDMFSNEEEIKNNIINTINREMKT